MYQSFHQEIDHSAKDSLRILLWCKSDNVDSNETILIRIEDFQHCFYAKPVDNINKYWTSKDELFECINNATRSRTCTPTSITISNKRKFYYYDPSEYLLLGCTFASKSAMDSCARIFKNGVFNNNRMRLKFTIHEDNDVSAIRKMYTAISSNRSQFSYSQWFKMESPILVDDPCDKISNCNHEYILSWTNLIPIDSKLTIGIISAPLIFSYDIECRTPNYNRFPNEFNITDRMSMISCVSKRLGNESTKKAYIITLCETNAIETVNMPVDVIRVNSEREMIEQFFGLVDRVNPDVLIGYNITSFDNRYINSRKNSQQPMCVNPCRIITRRSESVYEHRGFGKFSLNIPFTIPGRITIDILSYMQKMHPNELNHKLDYIAKKFLGANKHDVTPKDMFRIYDKNKPYELDRLLENSKPKDRRNILDRLSLEEKEILMSNRLNGVPEPDIEQATKVAAYCVQDSLLPIRIMDKQNTWIGQIELANIMGMSVEQLLLAGEQAKCFSLIYDALVNDGRVLIKRENIKKASSGGYVGVPKKGLHKNPVLLLDFASLYPNLVIEHNLCYTTLIEPGETSLDPNTYITTNFTQKELQVDPRTGKKPNKGTVRAKELTIDVPYSYRWIKEEVYQGILPRLMSKLLNERKSLRIKGKNLSIAMHKRNKLIPDHQELGCVIEQKIISEMDPEIFNLLFNIEEDPWKVKNPDKLDSTWYKGDKEVELMCDTYEAKQKAMKITANSIYGILNVREGGILPLPECAQTITYFGRSSIQKCGNYVENKMNQMDTSTIPKYLVDKYGIPGLIKPGTVVYGDTDSIFVKFNHLDNEDVYAFGDWIAGELTKLFSKSMEMEHEQAFCILLLVTKKRYCGIVMDRDGKRKINAKTGKPELYVKGLLSVRRDNCAYNRLIFNEMLEGIVGLKGMKHVLWTVYMRIHDLMCGKINPEDLSISTVYSGSYKSKTVLMYVMAQKLRERGKPPSVNERVEYVYCKHEANEKTLLSSAKRTKLNKGEICYTLDEVINGEAPGIDYLLYVEKFAPAIDQIFSITYNKHRSILSNITYKCGTCKVLNMLTPMAMLKKKLFTIEANSYVSNRNMNIEERNEWIIREMGEFISDIYNMIPDNIDELIDEDDRDGEYDDESDNSDDDEADEEG